MGNRVALRASIAVFWASGRNKYTLVLAPEGVPSISVSYWAFLAPGLAWLGCGLLCWRIADVVLLRGRWLVTAVGRPLLGSLAPAAASMLGRQRRMVSRSAVLLALAIAFAASTATFNATYRQQAEADAQLTNGADVTVTPAPGAAVAPRPCQDTRRVSRAFARSRPSSTASPTSAPTFKTSTGCTPGRSRTATALQDSYFPGASAASLMAAPHLETRLDPRLGRDRQGLPTPTR